MYVGATAISFTLVITVSVISIRAGFVETMLVKSNLYMHTLTPIFTLLLFTLAIADTHIKFRYSFMAIVPTFIYALLYAVCVFGTHVWRDHYYLGEFMPWPVAFISIMAAAYLLSLLLRLLHNLTNKHVTRGIERYYKESDDYKFDRIGDAIAHLAEVESKFYHEGDDIYVPVDIVKLLSERYHAEELALDIQYDIYLESYLKNIHKK
jgi:hypothetical protein